jgi:mono/diheme cytochrome c family protein
MKKALKWIGIVLLALLAIAGIGSFYFSTSFERRMEQTFEVNPHGIPIPTDSASLVTGKHLVTIHCAGCHGKDLAGTKFFDDPTMGSIPASNLTPGKGGIGGAYSEMDFVRAIRHGVKKSGKPAFVMPSKEFQYLSDQDLGYIIAYLKTTPPVDHSWDGPHLTYLAKALAGSGAFGDIINAENIDHASLVNVTAPAFGATAEYGKYLVRISGCQSCHGEKLDGRKSDEPGAPFSPNITPGGAFGDWTQVQFVNTMRTGSTPDNRKLDPKFMPWEGFKHMSEDELAAVYLHLKTLPKLASAD